MHCKRSAEICILLTSLFSFISTPRAQILEGLKDAVLNAEGIFSDIFKSIDTVAKQLKFSHETWKDTVEEECKFECPDGSVPKRNKYHKPTANGCGVPGMEIDSQYLPLSDMTKCCDQHDICYGTCNRDKDECDLAFKKCLYKLCDKSKTKMTETVLTGCKTGAKTLYTGTLIFGCKFYKDSQQQACYCPPSRKFTGEEL